MKTLTILFVLSLVLGASTPSSSAAESLAVVNETISGESFRVIEAAVGELRRLGRRAED